MSGFRWRDVLDLAGLLCNNSSLGLDEARQRTAVSRAYYAVFNFAKEKASGLGWKPSGRGRDHRDLVDWLSGRGMRLPARQLGAMRRVRNEADYDLLSTPGGDWAAKARTAVCEARKLLTEIDRLLPHG